MVIELDKIIDFLDYITKPENLHLLIPIIGIVVSALTTIVVKIIMYLLKRSTIPKLDFDGLWKEPNCKGKITCYYIKVKREKGEGEAEGVKGIVGIKDKELKPSEWRKSKSEIANIMNHDYLLIFETFYDKEKKIIFFPENIFADCHQSYENNIFNQYKEKTLEVQIEAKRGRIKKRNIKKNIDEIVNKAEDLPDGF